MNEWSHILTVAVINFNGGKYLQKCIESLPNDDFVQYVMVDGGSKDDSISIIENFSSKFDVIVSEPDKGQSDALNKSLKYASGKYFTWINSDDLMFGKNLTIIINRLSKSRSEWLIAGTRFIGAKGEYISEYIQPCSAYFMNKWGFVSVGAPSSIIKTSLIREIGSFDLSLNYCMDVDLWLRLWKQGYRYKNIGLIFYVFRIHDASKTSHAFSGQATSKFSEERRFVLEKNNRSETYMLIIIRKILSVISLRGCLNRLSVLKKDS